MADVNLIPELLRWIAARPRTYRETMEAWRSTCPRQTTWEDALLAGLVDVGTGASLDEAPVRLTPKGRATLE